MHKQVVYVYMNELNLIISLQSRQSPYNFCTAHYEMNTNYKNKGKKWSFKIAGLSRFEHLLNMTKSACQTYARSVT